MSPAASCSQRWPGRQAAPIPGHIVTSAPVRCATHPGVGHSISSTRRATCSPWLSREGGQQRVPARRTWLWACSRPGSVCFQVPCRASKRPTALTHRLPASHSPCHSQRLPVFPHQSVRSSPSSVLSPCHPLAMAAHPQAPRAAPAAPSVASECPYSSACVAAKRHTAMSSSHMHAKERKPLVFMFPPCLGEDSPQA